MNNGFDEVIHQPVRLRIMATLAARPAGDPVDFPWLKRMLSLTDGNLGAHLLTLEKAGYVTVEKSFVDRRPKTSVTLSPTGRAAFIRHVASLEAILTGAVGDESKIED